MAFVTIDHSKAQQGRYMPPEGVYECLIKNAQNSMTRNGTEYLQINLTIRDDVAQEGAGETIDWPVWRKKAPTRNDPDGFPAGTIQHISRVTGLANGTNFETIDDWMRALSNKPIRVEIRHEEYNGNTRARVSYVHETEQPDISPQAQGFVEVKDGELPF